MLFRHMLGRIIQLLKVKKFRKTRLKALNDREAARLLLEQIAYRIKKLNKDDTEEAIVDESLWMSGEDFISCIPCLKYSDMEKVPAALKKYKRGNFGRIKAKGEGFHIRHSQKEHEASDLHKWCAVKSEEIEKEKIFENTKNKQAAENTVRNVIFALKNGGGSELFLNTYTTEISAAFPNYRKKAETNCHIPFKSINKSFVVC